MNTDRPSLAALLALLAPSVPGKWTRRYLSDIIERGNRRIAVLNDRIAGVTDGRVMPDLDQVTIGSGRRFDLAVLFLDVCGFSARPNWTSGEQDRMLAMMNIFMAEMLNVVRDFGGTYEKNTGDGLMAYFGEDSVTEAERVKFAVEAAVVVHYVNDQLITPWFRNDRITAHLRQIPVSVLRRRGKLRLLNGLGNAEATRTNAEVM